MDLSTLQDWFVGGAAAVALSMVGLWWKIKSESGQARVKAEEAKDQASKVVVEAASAAMTVVAGAMDTQAKQIDDLSTRITNLDTRLTTMTERHEVAIVHIAERETWTVQRWSKRPEGLPPIPEAITAEVVKAAPSLAEGLVVDSVPKIRNPTVE